MSGKRLCEVKDELFQPLVQLVRENVPGAARLRLELESLRCPGGRNHCSRSGPCKGFTADNKLRIARLQDKLFEFGFEKENQR